MFGFTPVAAVTWADQLEQGSGGEEITSASDGFYAEMLRAAAEMLADFATGQVILVEETVTASTDDDPYAADTITTNDLPVNAVVLGYSTERIDGVQIQVGDVRIVMDATDVSNRPDKGQTVKIDGIYHNLVNVKPIPAAGDPCVYILQARTGN